MKKTIIISILILFTTLILSCDYNTPEMRPRNSESSSSTDNSSDSGSGNLVHLSTGTYYIDTCYYSDPDNYTLCSGYNVRIEINYNSTKIYIPGVGSQYINFYDNGKFGTLECSGTYQIKNRELHLTGLNYQTGYGKLKPEYWYIFR